MTNTKGGDRKRTVTVTVGPVTERLVREINYAMLKTPGNTGVNLTSLAGVGLQHVIKEWAGIWGVSIPEGWDYAGH